MRNEPIPAEVETAYYWMIANALRRALDARDRESVDDALNDLEGLALWSDRRRIRHASARLLDAHRPERPKRREL